MKNHLHTSTPYQVLRTAIKLLLGRGVYHSYSQSGEDLLLKTLLKKSPGVYVDVGAYHPVLYSNTYALYKKGWSGLVIDPNSSFRPLYSILRPRDSYVISGIGRDAYTGAYYQFSDASYNTFDADSASEYKKISHITFIGSRKVPIVPLRTILDRNKIFHIDLLNIDVEGLDLQVLESHDWSIPTTVVAVEDRHFNPDQPDQSKIYTFLRSHGFVLKGLARDTLIFKQAPKEIL